MAKEEKATEIEKEKRIDIVCELLIKGLTTSQMFRYGSEKTKWGISSRQLDNYISEAKQKIRNSDDSDKGFEIQRAKRRLESLYRKSEEIEDLRECRAIIETSAKLFGWNEAVKTINENINYEAGHLTDERIEEIKKKLNSQY